jgi:protein SPA2
VPYGRETRESLSTTVDDRERSTERGGSNLDSGRITDGEPESASDYASVQSPPFGGLSGLSARLRDVENEDDVGSSEGGIGKSSGDDYYNKSPFGRVSSERSGSGGASSVRTAIKPSPSPGDQEKMRSEYEYKIAKMQTQISTLQRDLGDADARERKWLDGEERVRKMEEELIGFRRVSKPTAT